jgi:hypothetical protein
MAARVDKAHVTVFADPMASDLARLLGPAGNG